MSTAIAIVGFRHAHIYDLVQRIQQRSDLQLVAVCEEEPTARAQLMEKNVCETVYDSYTTMLDSINCDVIGVGDYYAKRGTLIIEALRRGKHVISDKPICTSLLELDTIETLAREQNLSVGCQLDLRDHGNFRALHQLVKAGQIGEVHAVNFGGQHPLMYGTRASWYFEEGAHGGTINGIALHAIDLIPWVTGYEFSEVNCARAWNARLPQVPHFQDAAQVMLTLQNGCGVSGDVSYLAPDSHGYSLPHYWRTTVWGEQGMAETSYNMEGVTLCKNGEQTPRTIPAMTPDAGGYLNQFLQEVRGETVVGQLTTQSVLRASRVALFAQQIADNKLAGSWFE